MSNPQEISIRRYYNERKSCKNLLLMALYFFFLNDHLQSKDIFFHFYPIVQMYTLNSQLYNKEEKWWVLQCKRSSILLDFYDKWLPDKYIISICKKKY